MKIETIKSMVKDIDDATRYSSNIIIEETKAFVKKHHSYHSKNDFDIAHEKSMHELEAHFLYEKGWRNKSDIEEFKNAIIGLLLFDIALTNEETQYLIQRIEEEYEEYL